MELGGAVCWSHSFRSFGTCYMTERLPVMILRILFNLIVYVWIDVSEISRNVCFQFLRT